MRLVECLSKAITSHYMVATRINIASDSLKVSGHAKGTSIT